MKLEGWYTLADGKTVKDYVSSDVNNSGVEKTIELTAPRVLKSEVKTAGNDKILKSDTKTGAVAPADAPAQQTEKDASGKLVATYDGVKNVKTKADLQEALNNAKTAYEAKETDTAKKEAYEKAQAAYDAAPSKAEKELLIAQANLAKENADKARTAGPTDAAIQAYLGGAGAKASRIAGADRYLTALEIAKTQYPNGTNAKALYFANGMASADATVAGFIDNKAELAGPVLLVQKDSAPAEVTNYAKAARAANAALAGKFKGLGSVGVVSDSLVDQFKDLLK